MPAPIAAPQYAALDLYLQGRYLWNQRTEESIVKAIEYFTQAAASDPNYGLAYVDLSDAYGGLGFYGAMPPQVAFTLAKEAALKAIQLEERSAEAHSSLAFSILQYDWD